MERGGTRGGMNRLLTPSSHRRLRSAAWELARRRSSGAVGADGPKAAVRRGLLPGKRIDPCGRGHAADRRAELAIATAVLLSLVSACGASAGSASVSGRKASVTVSLAGRPLNPTVVQPVSHLIDTNGSPFDVRSGTAGRLAFVFFGYTHCPDVCPTTAADIAAALGQQTPAVRARTTFVFVTTDPERDSPQTMRRWLDQFDTSFIGLTGKWADIADYAAALGLPVVPPEQAADGSWLVQHVSRVTAFAPDGTARAGYFPSTTVADYSHDIPLLLENRL